MLLFFIFKFIFIHNIILKNKIEVEIFLLNINLNLDKMLKNKIFKNNNVYHTNSEFLDIYIWKRSRMIYIFNPTTAGRFLKSMYWHMFEKLYKVHYLYSQNFVIYNSSFKIFKYIKCFLLKRNFKQRMVFLLK